MSGQLSREPSPELAHRRREFAPDTQAAFNAFVRQVFAPSALDTKTKQLIAVAIAPAKSHDRAASDIMTKVVITVGETASVADTARALDQHRIKRVEGGGGSALDSACERLRLLSSRVAAGAKPTSSSKQEWCVGGD